MKRILVPCDFSDPAAQAFKFAVEIALKSRGEIFLLNVVEVPVMHETVLMPTLYFEQSLMNEMKATADKKFQKMKDKWGSEGITVSTHVEFGVTITSIRQFIEEKKIDLVVMGTHGASGAREFLIGSNTEKIVRTSLVPVMAIKKSTKLSNVKNIVFPNDLDLENEHLTLKVKELQNFFKATLHILYINSPAFFQRDVDTKMRLKDFAKRFMLKDYTLNVYNDVDQENGINNFTREVKGDLIALATHGRRGISHLVSGSIAEDIVNHVDCPIWTFKNEE
ncbi:MAG: universal stress protein [Flammeovirgaceae bacterium]|jgi:nucleotide-binding universal stress UspA family protein